MLHRVPPGRRPGSGLVTGADVQGALLTWDRRVVITAVIGFAVHQVVREWDEVSATLRQLPWPHVLLALVAVTGGVLLGPLVSRADLAAMGARVGVSDAAEI